MRRIKWILPFIMVGAITFSLCHAQEWAITYGGIYDEGSGCIQQTTDGGYIVAGASVTSWYSCDHEDFWVLKLSSDAEIEWQKTYGRGGGSSIQQTTDGGYIVAGSGAGSMMVLKLSPNGDIDWARACDDVSPHSVQQTSDGGYIVGCTTDSFGAGYYDLLVLKLDLNGDIEWQKTYGGSGLDVSRSIQQTIDGGYIVAGETESFGSGRSLWILKVDLNGDIEWQKKYGGALGRSIQQTIDGGYIVAGSTASYGVGGTDAWIMKLAPDGGIEWQKAYGESSDDYACSIQQTIDGGYIVAGETESFGSSPSLWILKLDLDGDIEWEWAYNVRPWNKPFIRQTTDNGYVLVSSTSDFAIRATSGRHRDLLVLKLNENGEIPHCSLMGISNATASNTSALIEDTGITPQVSSGQVRVGNFPSQDYSATKAPVCPGIIRDAIILRDLDNDIKTNKFRPGTNIRYKAKFTVNGDPNKLYKVVVRGKAWSAYKPDNENPEWIDKFDNPEKKRKKLYGGESNKVYWDRQIPEDATTGTKGKVNFNLKLKEYDQTEGAWSLLGIYHWRKKEPLKIVE